MKYSLILVILLLSSGPGRASEADNLNLYTYSETDIRTAARTCAAVNGLYRHATDNDIEKELAIVQRDWWLSFTVGYDNLTEEDAITLALPHYNSLTEQYNNKLLGYWMLNQMVMRCFDAASDLITGNEEYSEKTTKGEKEEAST